MRLLVAGIRKLVRRPASYVSLGLLVGLLSLILIAVGATAKQAAERPNGAAALLLVTFPQAYSLILSFILGLGGLIAVIYGAAIAGSEWNWGMLKAAVARGESRSRYGLLTFASVALLIGVGLVIAFLLGTVMALVGASLAGVSTAGLNDSGALSRLPDQLGRSWIAIIEEGALGFTVATLARSQLAGIGAGIALYFGEQFASIFLPDIVKYFPFNAATAVVENAGAGGGGIIQRLEPGLALVVVVAWLAGALLVAAVFTERADIAG